MKVVYKRRKMIEFFENLSENDIKRYEIGQLDHPNFTMSVDMDWRVRHGHASLVELFRASEAVPLTYSFSSDESTFTPSLIMRNLEGEKRGLEFMWDVCLPGYLEKNIGADEAYGWVRWYGQAVTEGQHMPNKVSGLELLEHLEEVAWRRLTFCGTRVEAKDLFLKYPMEAGPIPSPSAEPWRPYIDKFKKL